MFKFCTGKILSIVHTLSQAIKTTCQETTQVVETIKTTIGRRNNNTRTEQWENKAFPNQKDKTKLQTGPLGRTVTKLK